MLSELSIENFAIIDRLYVRFDAGFTVLTGETGAGKSIIIDALQTVLGAKVGADVVRANARFASVEAVFDVPDDGAIVSSLLAEHGIEDEGCLILRREVSAAGRGTARVNGRAVPLSLLSLLGGMLVDIHGQSDHLSVLRRDRQLEVLDRYGDLLSLRGRVAEAIRQYVRLQTELQSLSTGRREAEQRLDLLRFQVQEIESARLQPNEEMDLQAERNLLANAERLSQLAGSTWEALQSEGAALEGVTRAASLVRELASIDTGLVELANRLEAAQYELEDVAQEVRQYRDQVEYDPRRLDQIEERLDLLVRLKRKYGVTLEDVIAFGAEARAQMEDVENLDERLAALTQQVDAAEREAGALAVELSEKRQQVARALTVAMSDALQGLGLKGTSFEVEVTQVASPEGLALPGRNERHAYTQSGIDSASFLVSFNPGEPPRPIEKVASGGETSRFLLALKSVLADADRTPTLVFDEVDVGVGGRSGMVVGERLRDLAGTHQVISITHLPQVAALADQHIHVIKSVGTDRTSVAVRQLEAGERVVELAEMMSGTGTAAARRNAQELLEAAQRPR